MLKFGYINELDVVNGLYKVKFIDDDFVSHWLPYVVKNTKDNIDESPFDKDEHVACLMDENNEHGVILGATNTNKCKPKAADKDKRRTTYKDGTYIEYDRKNKKFTISAEGNIDIIKSKNVSIKSDTKVTIECDSVEIKGNLKVTKDIQSTTGNIKAITGDVMALTHSLSNHAHNVTAVGLLTGTPTP